MRFSAGCGYTYGNNSLSRCKGNFVTALMPAVPLTLKVNILPLSNIYRSNTSVGSGEETHPFLRLTQTYLLLLCRNFKFFLEIKIKTQKQNYCSKCQLTLSLPNPFQRFIALSKILASSSCQNSMWFR